MSYQTIIVETRNNIATIILNRPEQRNALSLLLMTEMLAALNEINSSKNITVVIIRGNGPAFSAGHDIGEMRNKDMHFFREFFSVCCDLMNKIQSIPQPVIAEVHGIATAAGCQLVTTCDLAIASDDARFATSGIKIGIFCSTPGVALARNIHRKKAMEMLLIGDLISAQEAVEIGLINKVVARAELEKTVTAWAEKIQTSSALVIGLGKQTFYHQIEMTQQAAYEYTREVMALNGICEDTQEGLAAFLEKRKLTKG